MKMISWYLLLVAAALAVPCFAENFVVKGDMNSAIHYELQQQITAGDAMHQLSLSFVIPRSFESPTYSQQITDLKISFFPEADERKTLIDARGNSRVLATWTNVPDKVGAVISFDAANRTGLKLVETNAPFPLTNIPTGMDDYLMATAQAQSDNPKIRKLSLQLTKDVKTQFDAVQQVVSWVVDNVRYVNQPPRYDAVYSQESGKGNCQNFSHLTAALLRSVGIPVRIVNGVTLNQPFSIAWEKGILTFKMGRGRHSWIEVWFPDKGWVPYDPQNMQLFVSNRFVRIEVGVDNNETKNDGLVRWSQTAGARTKPRLQETIAANFVSDSVKFQGARQNYGPKNLLLGPGVKAEFKKIAVALPPPPVVVPEEEKKTLRFLIPFVYGNMDFPENVDFAFPRATTASGANNYEMSRNFLVETAEYVTTKATQYAQVVVLKKPVKLQKIALALHKFGGEGWLWVDIFQDEEGKPGAPVCTSEMVNLDQLSLKPGYRWTTFDFKKDSPVLMPGSYWIALGFSGSPIINWFYTYGKPVGPVYGTRYKGVFQDDWSGALNYEFNYKVSGLTTK